MTTRALVLVALSLVACRREVEGTHDAAAPAPSAAPIVDAARSTALVRDEEVGPLIARLSENPGDFPSDNYVTNETSLLHVAPVLRDPRLKGRAYVGVGPDQNFTYLALLEPAVAYIVDIRRGNMLELMMFRGCFEASKTRAEFLSALLARRPNAGELLESFQRAEPVRALRDEGVARTLALLDRLHVVRVKGDEDAVARIHDAFFTRGLDLAYTMKNSGRKYPTLAENFAARDPSGAPATFLASDESYARVRRLVLDNRVLPVVGDFGGKHALKSVADDMRARGLLLAAFYTSNVEQYLFESHTYGNFVESVAAMPRDDASLLVRVWFDQGKAHPAQQPGHRTTQLTTPVAAFLARAEKKPFLGYCEVVNAPGLR
jgi:hypothetical protein